MKRQQIHRRFFYLLLLLLLPVTGFADMSFFAPPSTDISLKVIQAIFGSNTDSLNGQLIRPVLMVLLSGMVVFMGAVFAWNITKFVLHTSQQGEMMVGKGKELGLVVLRSTIGMAVVLPIYSGTYKGLCMAFVFVGFLIAQGVGLADQGVNAVVDYLTAGGTVYQTAQSSQDVEAKQDMAVPALGVLGAEACVYRLRAIKDGQDKATEDTNSAMSDAGVPTTDSAVVSSQTAVGYYFDAKKGQAFFGTQNTAYNPNDPSSGYPYNSECGTMTWNLATPGTPTTDSDNLTRNLAAQQMIVDLDPLARAVAEISDPSAPPDNITNLIPPETTTSIMNYSNLIGPLRVTAGQQMTQKTNDELQLMKQQGWIVLGAYYPMMGNLNRQAKAALSAFEPSSAAGGIASGQISSTPNSAYNLTSLSEDDKKQLVNQFNYVNKQTNDVQAFVLLLETANASTIQEVLNLDSSQGGGAVSGSASSGYLKWLNDAEAALSQGSSGNIPAAPTGSTIPNIPTPSSFNFGWGSSAANTAAGGAVTGLNYVSNALNSSGATGLMVQGANKVGGWVNDTGLGGVVARFFKSPKNQGETFAGLLDQGRLNKGATVIGLSAIVGGPIAWATVPPMLAIFVKVVAKFRNAIDQTQNPDPLLALQDFGFYTLDEAMLLILLIYGGIFATTLIPSFIPSANPVGAMGTSAAAEIPLITMAFAALAGLGIGCAIYIPMIPFIVWIAAILGWIGHAFQAIVGAPLVALRMTTAEGEGVMGGATEGVMMLLGVLLTPFLLVMGMTATLILIKQLMILVNYLFSLFAYYSLVPHSGSFAWLIIGVPAVLFIYMTLMITVVQGVSTKLIGEMPGEVLRHLHTAMTGHKAGEQMGQKMEQATEKVGGQAGDLGGKKAYSGSGSVGGGGSRSKAADSNEGGRT